MKYGVPCIASLAYWRDLLAFLKIPPLFSMDFKNSTENNEKVDANYNVVPLREAMCKTERRLRRKIDIFVVPTVMLMYLMCFIDRANIGKHVPL